MAIHNWYQKAINIFTQFWEDWLKVYLITPGFLILKKYRLFFVSFLVAFLISDLLLIKAYHFLIPDKNLPPLSSVSYLEDKAFSGNYQELWKTNIFHTGPIPSQLKTKTVELDPVLSSLPFNLKGTIIHANPKRSVATIQAGSLDKTFSYREGDLIENQAEIRSIERAKVVFFNQNNNLLEYILIPEETNQLDLSYYKQEEKSPIKSTESKNSLMRKMGENNYQVDRSVLNEHLMKLPEILNQARMVPHREAGEIVGFRFASIDKDSVFEKLGFQKGDIIKGVDGESVTNPEQALELFERLKGESGFKMLVEKEGQEIELEYNVKEDAPIM